MSIARKCAGWWLGLLACLGCGVQVGHVRVYEGQRIRLASDGSEGASRALFEHLERAAITLERYGFPYTPALEKPTELLLLTDLEGFSLGEMQASGVFSDPYRGFLDRPAILVAGRARPVAYTQAAVHELTHRFAHHHIPAAPIWLDEGLAEYFSSVEFEGDLAVLGRHILAAKQRGVTAGVYVFDSPDRPMDVTTLRGLDGGAFQAAARRAYPSAWSLVHALSAGPRRPLFARYLDELQAGEHAEPGVFSRVYGDLPPDVLVKDQISILTNAEYETEQVKIRDSELSTVPNPPIAELVGIDREVWLARAWLTVDTGRALEHLARAEELAPEDPETLLLLAMTRIGEDDTLGAAKLLRRAVTASAHHPRYVSALLRLLLSAPGASSGVAEQKRLATELLRSARTAVEMETAARFLVYEARWTKATELARRVVQADPSYADGYELVAEVAAKSGDVVLAARSMLLAVNLSPAPPREWEARSKALCAAVPAASTFRCP